MKQEDKKERISIRRTDELDKLLDVLKQKLLLNTSATIRLALVKLYEAEIEKNKNQGRL